MILWMFDRVIVAASDLEASRAFYTTLLGPDWGNFELAPANGEATRRLHVAFVAASHGDVDAFWRRGVDAGYESDGEPRLRPQYDTDYYGAFLLDPDGNSVESVTHAHVGSGEGKVDHLWIGVRDLASSRRFWERVAAPLGLRFTSTLPERFHLAARGRSFAVVADGREPSEHVHLVFPLSREAPGFSAVDPDGNTIEARHAERPALP
jgi:catechol 2,3-dioxygenase-like lactoylglutathione lyase family enzyme